MRPVDTPSLLATSETRVAAKPRSITTWQVISRISVRRSSTVVLFTRRARYKARSAAPRIDRGSILVERLGEQPVHVGDATLVDWRQATARVDTGVVAALHR